MTEKQKIFSGPLSQRARKILKSLYGLESDRTINESPKNFRPSNTFKHNQGGIDGDQLSWSHRFRHEKKEPKLGMTSAFPSDVTLNKLTEEKNAFDEKKLSGNFFLLRNVIKDSLIHLLNIVGFYHHRHFSKSRYARESKGTYLIDLVLAVSILFVLIVAVFLSDFTLLKSEVGSIKSRIGNIQDIKDKTNSVNRLLGIERASLESKKQTYSQLQKHVFDQSSIKDLVTKFLAELENNRVTVKISLARFSNSPVYETKNLQRPVTSAKDVPSSADRLKEMARIATNKEPIANQVAQEPKNKTEKGKLQGSQDLNLAHFLPEDADLITPYDANRLGINYYYIKLELSGAYINYLAIRQQLISLVPGAIIESEKVTSQNNKSTVTIVVGINLPFYQEKN
jgi:hypothetical protein